MNSYFSHDSNARNDEKMIRLRMKHGAEGYGVYFMLLERLRDETDYMSIKDYNVIAFDLRVDANLIKDVVENYGLFAFTEDGKCFYSDSFNKRMSLKDAKQVKRSAAGKKGAAKRWNGNAIAKPSDEDSNAMAMPSEIDSKRSKERKESKVNKTKDTDTMPASGDKKNLSLDDEFRYRVWDAYPKRTGYKDALDAYKQARQSGEVTLDQVLAKITEYKQYIALNKIQPGYVKSAKSWFEAHDWMSEWDTTKPEKTQQSNRAQRVERKPEWAQPGYEAPKHELTPEEKAKLNARIAALSKPKEDATT